MGGGGGGSKHSRELDQTPTWAVALVSAVIIIISIILEKTLHRVGETFEKRKKKALVEALEKIKGELMVLGFISLLLTFGQNYIARVCIPEHLGDTMLPCPKNGGHSAGSEHSTGHSPAGHSPPGHSPPGHSTGHTPELPNESPPAHETTEHHRRLLWYEHRFLAADSTAKECKLGYVPLISINGLHQLHIFIFFLAIFHVIYSAITMMLGRLKIRGWKVWEREFADDYEISNDPTRFRLTHQTSFVRDHTSFWTKTPILFYTSCFFRQFFRSVTRSDYLAMRHGFISVHLAPGSKFDFQKYIKRSLEDDFKVVVGITPVLWFSAVVYLLLNVSGWQTMFILSIMPFIMMLVVGSKLQAIITQMAVEIQERHAVVQGIPLVQVSDHHFWFGWPKLVLHLIHFTLFQNAFDITYFIWISYEFGLYSCFHDSISFAIFRVGLGLGVQFLCSYITLPLYALVTQMGSNMKRSIFDEQTSKALMNWHKHAKKKNFEKPAAQTLGGSPRDSQDTYFNEGTRSSIEMMEAPSLGTANITASVDIPGENHDGNGKRDLLSGM